MASPTDRFKEEIKRSHEVVAYVDVRTNANREFRLTAVDGNVRVDRSAKIRRSCTVSCVDVTGELTPVGPESDLVPFGTEIRPYRGVRYSDGTEEVHPLGVFRLSKAIVVDSEDGVREINLEGHDLSRTIQRDKFVDIYSIDQGTNVIAAIQTIVERTFPEVEYDLITTAVTTAAPLIYEISDDPWETIQELALAAGCEAYFDTEGRFVVAPSSTMDEIPSSVFDYTEGPRCTMLDLSREFTDDPGFNGVAVSSEAVGDENPPITVVLWDDDPESPTYHLGPYGENPTFHTDKIAKTEAELTAVASQILHGLLGFAANISVRAMVNPALEAGDVVTVTRELSHVAGYYSAEAFNIPFAARGTQDVDLKQVRSS